MKINGNLEVLGKSDIKISDELPAFLEEDLGRLVLHNSKLKVNNGSEFITVADYTDINDISNIFGEVLLSSSISFDPSSFSNFKNVSNLTGNSSIFDVLSQLDASISNSFFAEYQTTTNSHNVNHNLNSEIGHVTVVDLNTGIKVKDSEMVITFLDSNNIKIDLTQNRPIKVLMNAL